MTATGDRMRPYLLPGFSYRVSVSFFFFFSGKPVASTADRKSVADMGLTKKKEKKKEKEPNSLEIFSRCCRGSRWTQSAAKKQNKTKQNKRAAGNEELVRALLNETMKQFSFIRLWNGPGTSGRRHPVTKGTPFPPGTVKKKTFHIKIKLTNIEILWFSCRFILKDS